MIGIIIELLISWLLLWWFDKSNLAVLGFKLTQNNALNLIFGFFAAALFSVLYYTAACDLANTYYTINPSFNTRTFFKSSWWVLSSVLFEELIFRGALLYILIQKMGIKKACIVSAIAFGIYHWFSYGAFGNPVQMAIVFLMTGIWGLMFAFAYAKTKTLYLPIGLHFGWNFIHTVIFSKGPLGQQFLIINSDKKLEGMLSLVFFIIQIIGLPVLAYFYLKSLDYKKRFISKE
jgi:uncharacterized protein